MERKIRKMAQFWADVPCTGSGVFAHANNCYQVVLRNEGGPCH